MNQKVVVAAAHIAPVYLNTVATTDKICQYIRQAGEQGVELLVFPESVLPGFPVWPAVSAPIYNHDFFAQFAASSVHVPGPEVLKICTAARQFNMIVSIGISEATTQSVGCLWNSNLLIGADGSILNHHRKLVPTFFEKLIWANGDGAGLRVCDTPLGRIGGLICGENTNPLARYALMAQGEQIHVSSYPPVWPTHDPGEENRYDLPAAIRIRAGAHCFEAKVFNVVASSRLDDSAYEVLDSLGPEAIRILKDSPKGTSMILGPGGMPIAETSTDVDQLLIMPIDLQECVVPKQYHDVVGYYNRFDIFNLTVDRRDLSPVTFTAGESSARTMAFESLDAVVGQNPDAR